MNATNGTILLALAGLWLANRAVTASEVCRRYRAWQRDCNAIAGIAARAIIPLWLRKLVGFFLLVAECIWLVHQGDQVGQWMALGPGLAALLLALQPLMWLLKRLMRALRRKPARYRGPVLIVVPGPIGTVPSLSDAYSLVPNYCQQIMQVSR